MTRAAKAQERCDRWNTEHCVGLAVSVQKDDGTTLLTRTRSQAWVICDHPSVLVEGISGGYSLDRVMPIAAARAQP